MKEPKNPAAVALGKLRWKGVPKADLSKQMTELVAKRWGKKKLDKKPNTVSATE